MRTTGKLACLSFALLLGACGPSGYYDANGNYYTPSDADRYRSSNAQRYHDASDRAYETQDGYYEGTTTTIVPTYSERGYYDYYGNYVPMDTNIGVPQSMMPPPGMCRVWIPNRDLTRQPGIESCDGIRGRVPAGGYVIYGG